MSTDADTVDEQDADVVVARRDTTDTDVRSHEPASAGSLGLRISHHFKRWSLPALALALGLFVWWFLAEFVLTPILFASPQDTFRALIRSVESGILLENTLASLSRIGIGYGIGVGVGAPVGLLMGSFKSVRNFLEPYVGFLRFLPPIALLPLAIVWFGIGEVSKWFLIAFSAGFIMVLNAMAGVFSIPDVKVWAAQMLGLDRRQIFFRVMIPSSIPFIITGMRIAMGNAFMTIVAAEMLAADSGLGYMIFTSRSFFQTSNMFVGLFAVSALGYVIDLLLRRSTKGMLSAYGLHESKAAK